MQSFKKIVGADFEKIDKVDFRYIQTYIQRVSYRTFPFGRSNIVGLDFEKINKVYFRDTHTDIQTYSYVQNKVTPRLSIFQKNSHPPGPYFGSPVY